MYTTPTYLGNKGGNQHFYTKIKIKNILKIQKHPKYPLLIRPTSTHHVSIGMYLKPLSSSVNHHRSEEQKSIGQSVSVNRSLTRMRRISPNQ